MRASRAILKTMHTAALILKLGIEKNVAHVLISSQNKFCVYKLTSGSQRFSYQ